MEAKLTRCHCEAESTERERRRDRGLGGPWESRRRFNSSRKFIRRLPQASADLIRLEDEPLGCFSGGIMNKAFEDKEKLWRDEWKHSGMMVE